MIIIKKSTSITVLSQDLTAEGLRIRPELMKKLRVMGLQKNDIGHHCWMPMGRTGYVKFKSDSVTNS